MAEPAYLSKSNMRFRNREGLSFFGQPVLRLAIAILLLLFASAILYQMVDDNLGIGWPNNVIRNWDQYGLLTLKGRLVINPGGAAALSQPDYYGGHRAASLYPAFVLRRAFAWTGAGMLPVLITLSLGVSVSVWWLMGRSDLALLTACAAGLCPGYLLHAADLDPNAMAALAGLPFAAIVLSVLRRPRLSVGTGAALTCLIVAYSSINWSTALVHGAIMAAIMVAPGITFRRLALYVGLAGGCALLVVAFSAIQKYGQSTSVTHFLAGYTWGNTGYDGRGLTTARAVVRLATVNTLGLFPLLLLCVYVVTTRPRSARSRKWLCVLPLLTTLLGIGALRNYFGHHPWMAGPFLLVGVVLSFWVWIDPPTPVMRLKDAKPGAREVLIAVGFLLAMFCFAWAVIFFYRSRQENVMPLINLVRLHTQRSVTLVIESNRDPDLAWEVLRLQEALDRHIKVVETLGAEFSFRGATLLLTASESGARGSLAGRSSHYRMKSLPWVDRLLAWYGRNISHRQAGDRIELAPDYLLYEVNPRDAL